MKEKTREEALALARRLYKMASHEKTPETEKMSAQEKLHELQEKWEFTDTEVSIDPDVVEGEPTHTPSELAEAWGAILEKFNLTEQQFYTLLGEFVAEAIGKRLSKLIGGFFGGKS